MNNLTHYGCDEYMWLWDVGICDYLIWPNVCSDVANQVGVLGIITASCAGRSCECCLVYIRSPEVQNFAHWPNFSSIDSSDSFSLSKKAYEVQWDRSPLPSPCLLFDIQTTHVHFCEIQTAADSWSRGIFLVQSEVADEPFTLVEPQYPTFSPRESAGNFFPLASCGLFSKFIFEDF